MKLKCSQIMNFMMQSSRQRALKTQLCQLWRPLAAAIKVRFWRSMGRLEDLSCTQKNVWWLLCPNVGVIPALLELQPLKNGKNLFRLQILGVIWKTPRIRGLNSKHYRQTSLTNPDFEGYLRATRACHNLSQNIRKSSR